MNKRMRKKKRLALNSIILQGELFKLRGDFTEIALNLSNTIKELKEEISTDEKQIKQLEHEIKLIIALHHGEAERVKLLEESQVALVRENTMLKDRLATFEKINEDNVVVANDKFTSLEKECQEMRKELNKMYLQKKPWWKR